MATIQEVAVTSCVNDPAASVHVWDVLTGTSLMTYRGDTSVTSAGVSVLCGEYIVAALQDKPFLRVWPVNSQQPLSTPRFVCAGKVTHAVASPDNCYIALTVAEKLHLYQIASGQLVGSGVRHFQPVRVVCWSSDGSHVVCGGEDGLVTVWSLTSLAEPRHVWADHTLPVTDLVLTPGPRPRLISVSADRTCKIYDLHEGSLRLSVVFDSVLTAITVSVLETDVFVGTDKGSILQLSMLSPPRHLEYHLTDEDTALVFLGHTKAVRTLSVSLAGELLMSGSADSTVKIWHISSRQCLRTLNHKGTVTNAFFTLRPTQMFENELKPSVVLTAFRTTNSEETDCVEVITKQSLALRREPTRELFPQQATSRSNEENVKSLQMEIDLLRSINLNLYKFTVDKVIAGNSFKTAPVSEITRPVQNTKKRKINANFVITKPVKKSKKKKNNLNTGVDIVSMAAPEHNTRNSVTVVTQHRHTSGSPIAPVNRLPKNKKRRKKKKKQTQIVN